VQLKGVVQDWIDPSKKTDKPEKIEIDFEDEDGDEA
jgi:hypothetical protein